MRTFDGDRRRGPGPCLSSARCPRQSREASNYLASKKSRDSHDDHHDHRCAQQQGRYLDSDFPRQPVRLPSACASSQGFVAPGPTVRRRAVAVAATHPIAAVAKGRKMRKSIATLENASLTPPATPTPGSRWSSVDRHHGDRRDEEHRQPGTGAGQSSGAPAHRGASTAPSATHPHDQWHPDQHCRAGPSAHRIDRADDALPRESRDHQPCCYDEETPDQPQPAPHRAGPAVRSRRRRARHESGQHRQHDPVPRVGGQPEVDEPKAEHERAAQRNGYQCCHWSHRSPWWQQHDAGHAPKSEAPPPRTPFDPVQLAKHCLTPIDPVGGEQSDRPLQQPERHVTSYRLRVWSWMLATPQHRPCARQQQDREH